MKSVFVFFLSTLACIISKKNENPKIIQTKLEILQLLEATKINTVENKKKTASTLLKAKL